MLFKLNSWLMGADLGGGYRETEEIKTETAQRSSWVIQEGHEHNESLEGVA